jgi:hypothetical protein
MIRMIRIIRNNNYDLNLLKQEVIYKLEKIKSIVKTTEDCNSLLDLKKKLNKKKWL